MGRRERLASGLLADGRRRVLDATRGRIERDIRGRYAKALSEAGWLRRVVLHFRIRAEIREKLEKAAPRGGLYLKG